MILASGLPVPPLEGGAVETLSFVILISLP